MPVSTQFIDKKTDLPITLVDLDKELCELQDIRPDDRRMCGLYDFICLTGIGYLMKQGGSEITDEAALKEYLNSREHIDESEKEMLLDYLVRNYTFKAWR